MLAPVFHLTTHSWATWHLVRVIVVVFLAHVIFFGMLLHPARSTRLGIHFVSTGSTPFSVSTDSTPFSVSLLGTLAPPVSSLSRALPVLWETRLCFPTNASACNSNILLTWFNPSFVPSQAPKTIFPPLLQSIHVNKRESTNI